MRRLLLFAAMLAFVLPVSAQAAAGPAFGLRTIGKWPRGFFVYSAPGGRVLHGSVGVLNSGGRRGTVKLFAVDATTGRTSGVVYLTSGESFRGVGGWISLERESLTLGPRRRANVPFTVRIPAGTDPGQFVGGIVAETVARTSGPTSKGKARVQVNVRNLSIVAVQVNVPGPLSAKLEIGPASAGGLRRTQQVFVHLANTGNVMLKPSGSLLVEDHSGKQVASERLRLDTLLPGTAIDYPITIHRKGLGAGDYQAHVSLRYRGLGGGGTGVATASPKFTITKEELTQVFGPSGKGTPAPNAPSGKTVGSETTVAAPAATKAHGGGSGTLLKVVLLVLGAAVLLGLGYVAAVWRIRRPGRPAA